MGMGKSLREEITEWGILAMIIVILSVILLQFKITSTVACTTDGYIYNASENFCQYATNISMNESIRSLSNDIGTWVVSLSEPKNWVIIVIVGLIGFALVKMFTREKS